MGGYAHERSGCSVLAEWERGPDTISKLETLDFGKLTRKYSNGQQVHEKMLSIIYPKRNVNQNHREMLWTQLYFETSFHFNRQRKPLLLPASFDLQASILLLK